MSDMDDTQPEMAEALKKMTKYNKNVVSLMDMMKKALEKLEAFAKSKPVEAVDVDKEKMDKIFEKKQVGRPRGSWDEKQQQYLKMLNEGKIKLPKAQTLEFYKIEKDGEVFKTMSEWKTHKFHQ